MKAHTYYIIFERPLIGGGKLPPSPPLGGATDIDRRRRCLPLVGLRVIALDVEDRRDAVEAADREHHVVDHLPTSQSTHLRHRDVIVIAVTSRRCDAGSQHSCD